jgi:putative ABC transport system permease protein
VVTVVLPSRLRTRFGDDLRADIEDLRREARRCGGRRAELTYLARELLSIVRLATERSDAPPGDATMNDRLRSDVAAAWRAVRARPAFDLTAAATLAVAIAGAATALGLSTAVLWRPLPFAAEERLVFVWEEGALRESRGPARVTGGRYSAWHEGNTAFAGMALFSAAGFSMETADGRVAVHGVRVSAGYFDVLGIAPIAGRTFLPDEDSDGHQFVVVLSHEFWQQRYGGAQVIGDSIHLSGRPYTIIGVMPPAVFPAWPVNPAGVTISAASRQIWVPMPRTPQLAQNTRSHVYGVIGRLKEGVSIPAATADLAALAGASPDPHGPHLAPFREQLVSAARHPLIIVLASALAVLLVACANLAALHLASFERRRGELATRASLGAGAAALVRLLTIEALMVSLAGGLAGVAATRVLLAWLPRALPSTVPSVTAPSLDIATAAAAAVVAMLSGLSLALWPVIRVLRDGPAPRGLAPQSRSRAYGSLVVAQLAVTVALVSVAAWLGQSLWTVQSRDPGFAIDGVVVADVSVPGGETVTAADAAAAEDRVRSGVGTRPGVTGVALAYDHPLEANWADSYELSGIGSRPEETSQAQLRIVSPSYFDALSIVTLDGHLFADRDRLGESGVAVVNESFARHHGGAVIGRTLRAQAAARTWPDAPAAFTIVGVIEDERFRGLEEPSQPAFYLSTKQFPLTAYSLLVRSSEPRATAADLRASVRAVEPRASIETPQLLSRILADQMAARRLTTDVLGGFAGATLLLAGLGLYGLLAIMVAGQTREVGVRLALGATPSLVARDVIGYSVRHAAIGLAAGLVFTMFGARLVESLLVGVTARDPVTIAGVIVVMVLTALAAALVPALRAARVDAMRALRAE